tara:strand:+ start:124 stop:762 length:639 start_codon:yes stop_codon:yes gene_type:complete
MTKYFLIKGRILSFLVTLFKPVSIHNYLKFQKIYNIWANIKMDEVSGDYLEFGILKGKSLLHSYRCYKKLDLSEKNFYGFDSFQGFPTENHNFFTNNNFISNSKKVRKTFKKIKNIHIVEGFFEDTLRQRNVEDIEQISFVFIDCDIYESALSIFPYIKKRVNPGSFIMIDDFSSIDKNGNSIFKTFSNHFEIGKDCLLYDTYSNGQIYRVV